MIEIKPIETAPKDGTRIILYNKVWDSFPIASWEIVEGYDEMTGEGGFCLWFLQDETFPTSNEDGCLWPDEDVMPTHWWPVPKEPEAN